MTLSHALIARLRFIDFLLDKYGHFNRHAIADYFALSIPQVSLDIQHYIDQAPANVIYNRGLRRYERTPEFARAWP